MANRFFNQFQFSLEKNPVHLFARITIGATGAPTLDAANSKGFKSISRVSAGKYTLVLSDQYLKLLGMSLLQVIATAPSAPSVYVTQDNVAGATPSITIQFNAAGTATDPDNGDDVRIHLKLKNSTAF